MYKYVLLVHVLAATVWTGGHLTLALSVLPKALKERSPDRVLAYEAAYERVGLPALILQLLTGLWLAYAFVPDPAGWFRWDNLVSKSISIKLALLLLTVLFALDARLRVIPRLEKGQGDIVSLALHIIPVSIISVLFVLVGVGIRTGGFF